MCRHDFGHVAAGRPIARMTRMNEVRMASPLTAPASRQTVRAIRSNSPRDGERPALCCRLAHSSSSCVRSPTTGGKSIANRCRKNTGPPVRRPMTRRKTPTTSGTSGTFRSHPVLIRQPSSALFRTCSQPASRSTSSISKCTNSPTRSPVLAKVKWTANVHPSAAVRKAVSVSASKTKIGLASWTLSRSSRSSANGLPAYGGKYRRRMANPYIARQVSRMNWMPLSRNRRRTALACPFGATSTSRKNAVKASARTSWACGGRACVRPYACR